MRKEGGGAEIKRILKVFLYFVCARKEEGEQDERGIWEVFFSCFMYFCNCMYLFFVFVQGERRNREKKDLGKF